ncbi:reverse transcriptase domain-containing protein [Tanacetum coccineum]
MVVTAAKVERWAMPTWCHMFNSALTGSARVWFDDLPLESVDSYDDFKKAFLANFLQQKKCIKDSARKLSHVIKELKQGSRKDQLKTTKKGEASSKDKAMAILMVQSWKRVSRQRVTRSFSPDPEILFPPLGDEDGAENPMIIEAEIGGHFVHRIYVDGGSSSSYNGIIGRPGDRKIQAVPSTANEMLKFLVPGGILTLRSSKIIPLECMMVSGPEARPSAVTQATGKELK